jgi:hypothetical protein
MAPPGVRCASERDFGGGVRRLAFSPERPLHRAYERNPARMERWRREELTAIQRQAKTDNALIFYAERGARNRSGSASASDPCPDPG